MKQTQIEALVSAHRGRIQEVASLHVLSQRSLDDDDQAFLSRHAGALSLCDLLRWLARSPEGPQRGTILRALAAGAEAAPGHFEHEALGAAGKVIEGDEWGEIASMTGPAVGARLRAELLARTSGGPTFQAVARARGYRPVRPLTAAFFGEHEGDLGPCVEAAFEGRASQVAEALLGCRYDERACRRALSAPPAGAYLPGWLFELERAGLLGEVEALHRLLPASTAWWCERPADAEGTRQAYLRHVAWVSGGEAGAAWLLGQAAAALGRGAPASALLDELPPGFFSLLEGSPEAMALLRDASARAPLREVLALRAALPSAVDDEALSARIEREACEGDDDWGPLASLLPPSALGAAEARVRRSFKGSELTALLDWMMRQGVARRKAVDLAIEAIERGLLQRALVAWMSRQLATRASWEQRGVEVLRALVRAEALPELSDLLAMAFSEASGEEGPAPGFCEAIHGAFAEALLAELGEALARGERRRALSLASSMACLDPPSRFHRRLSARHDDAEVEQLLDVVRSMARHGGGREADLRGAVAAVHSLASCEGSG